MQTVFKNRKLLFFVKGLPKSMSKWVFEKIRPRRFYFFSNPPGYGNAYCRNPLDFNLSLHQTDRLIA